MAAADHPDRMPVAVAGLRHHYAFPANLRPAARLLTVNSGVFLISTAGAIVLVHTAGNPPAIDNDPAYALVAFVLFLLGIWLMSIALVADQFPRAAGVAVAIARALQDYLIGGN
uniref:Xa7 n=2 Tax=Oryza sativa TaxID=4530 RepID=A0A887SSQ6_ORYSI|nr:Xa7 [Oryza sativa Indica Group]QTT61011.1 XA7 [Oryza sativa Indica Group]QTT61012.1 XA7 [Oryza sativa]QWW20828.1 Xa7 [Oryza sativa Indica Group]UMZ39519.1 Xa7 [Oryza sativa Indica Group]